MVLIKPKGTSLIDPSNRKQPDLETNFKTYESYMAESTDKQRDENNWSVARFHGGGGPEDEMRRFLSSVHVDKNQSVRKTVQVIVRCKAIDWNHPKNARKEFLTYSACFYGKDLTGVPVAPAMGVLYGKFWETVRQPQRDEEGKIQNVFVEQRPAYYIPFSKKAVDDIIKSSDDENIKLCVKFDGGSPGEGSTGRVYVTYDQFVNWTWEELLAWWQRDPNKFLGDYTKKLYKVKAKR